MNTKTSNLIFAFILFVGFLPLSFTFTNNETQLLLDTDFKYVVWCFQAFIILLLILTRYNLSKDQLFGLTLTFIFVPLTFAFNENGSFFLIFHGYISTMLSWTIAIILLCSLLSWQKVRENSNL